MDRLTAAKVFIDVSSTNSFTASADRLDMSRPMVTRYIDSLETWLQARLLHRTTRKVSLTVAGESVLEELKTWTKHADTIFSSINSSTEMSGKVRIATSMSFGFSQLIQAIQGFMEKYPKVRIDIDLNDTAADLAEQQIDLAIRIASNPDPSLIGKPIALCESIIVASPVYLKSNDQIVKPDDLKVHSCLGYKNFQQHVWHLRNGEKEVSIDVDCRLTANEATTLLHATLAGAGIAIQPRYLVSDYLKGGELRQLLPEWKPDDLNIYVLYSSRKHMSSVIRTLIDYLSAYYKGKNW